MEEVCESLDGRADYFLRPFTHFTGGGEGQGITQENSFVYWDLKKNDKLPPPEAII